MPSRQEASALKAKLIEKHPAASLKRNLSEEGLNLGIKSYLLQYTGKQKPCATQPNRDSTFSLRMSQKDFLGLNMPGEEYSVDPELDNIAMLSTCHEDVDVPAELQHQISTNFFLDAISAASPLAMSEHPLAVVGKQSVISLEISCISESPEAFGRMIHFLMDVEAGHPESLCE